MNTNRLTTVQIIDDQLEFVLADDWLLYYKDIHGNMYFYLTELWSEWLEIPQAVIDRTENKVELMRPYRYNHKPIILFDYDEYGNETTQLTFTEFMRQNTI